MPEFLTQFQIEHFKDLLLRRTARLRADLCGLPPAARHDKDEKTAEACDQASAHVWAQHPAESATVDSSRYAAEINDLDAALVRIAAHTFGLCLDCKQPVHFKRLILYPTAKRCSACQRLYEIGKNTDRDCDQLP